jgi:hypothetical protein
MYLVSRAPGLRAALSIRILIRVFDRGACWWHPGCLHKDAEHFPSHPCRDRCGALLSKCVAPPAGQMRSPEENSAQDLTSHLVCGKMCDVFCIQYPTLRRDCQVCRGVKAGGFVLVASGAGRIRRTGKALTSDSAAGDGSDWHLFGHGRRQARCR